MILHVESPEAKNVVVFLNDRPIKNFIRAQDGTLGWVEIVDIAALSPITDDSETIWTEVDPTAKEIEFAPDESAWTPLKTKKITGKVEFRRLG